MCGYKMGDVSPPARSAKLKIIYGSKTSKTAYLDTISIQIFTSTCIMYMVGGYSQGGRPAFKGGRVPPRPP